MKKIVRQLFLLVILVLGSLVSCSKDDAKVIPTVTIGIANSITQTSTIFIGEVTSIGSSPVTARGICWGIQPNPTTSDSKTTDGSGIGSFTSSIIGLIHGTTYYARAYAINSVGIAYSSQVTFNTLALLPVLTTNPLTEITTKSATSGGNITSDGGAPVIARGVCWSITSSPTIGNVSKTIEGIGTGSFISKIIDLKPLTTYYFRAYATNSAGTSYGNELKTTTLEGLPTIPAYKTTLLYSGVKIIEEDKFQWNVLTNTWVNYSKIIRTYDLLGHRIGAISSKWDTNKWVNDSKYVSSNFLYGQMWTGISYQWNLSTQSWAEWNKDDDYYTVSYIPNTVYSTHYTWDTWTGWKFYNDYRFTVTLDSKGRIIQKISDAYDQWLTGFYGARYKMLYKYDSKGNIIDLQHSSYDSTYGWSDTGIIVDFTYDAFGNPTQKLTRTWSSNLSMYVYTSKIIYTYTGGLQTEYIEYTN